MWYFFSKLPWLQPCQINRLPEDICSMYLLRYDTRYIEVLLQFDNMQHWSKDVVCMKKALTNSVEVYSKSKFWGLVFWIWISHPFIFYKYVQFPKMNTVNPWKRPAGLIICLKLKMRVLFKCRSHFRAGLINKNSFFSP